MKKGMVVSMTKELLKVYTARITQASPSELVVIMYEIMIEDIKEAKNASLLGEKDRLVKELNHAKKFLQELMGTLDYSYKLSYELMNLYMYVNKILIDSIVKLQDNNLDGAIMVLEKLLVGFRQVSKEDIQGPVMKNTEQIYAGLTYGKGTLNEMYLDNHDNNRGFQA